MTDFDEIKTDDVEVASEPIVDVDVVEDAADEVVVDFSNKAEAEEVAVEEPALEEVVVSEPTCEVADNNASEEKEDGKKKKKVKKDKKVKEKVEAEVVEVDNIPSEVVSTKDSKKSKKALSFICFTIIILSLLFSIIDWVVSGVTKDPQIMLHLMDWIVMVLYIFIAAKALPFLNGKKKWVKVLFWICVVATLVCILVPMVLDYVELSNAIKDAEAKKEAAKGLFSLFA